MLEMEIPPSMWKDCRDSYNDDDIDVNHRFATTIRFRSSSSLMMMTSMNLLAVVVVLAMEDSGTFGWWCGCHADHHAPIKIHLKAFKWLLLMGETPDRQTAFSGSLTVSPLT